MRKGIVAAAATVAMSAAPTVISISPASSTPTAAPNAVCSLGNGTLRGSGFAPNQTLTVVLDGKAVGNVSAGPNGDLQAPFTGAGVVSVGPVQCTSSTGALGDASAAIAKGEVAAQQAVRSGASRQQAAAIGLAAARTEAQRLGLPSTVVNQVVNTVNNTINNIAIGGQGNAPGGTVISPPTGTGTTTTTPPTGTGTTTTTPPTGTL